MRSWPALSYWWLGCSIRIPGSSRIIGRRQQQVEWHHERSGGTCRARNRFQFVTRNLHVTNNGVVTAAHGRAWKAQSVVNVLQRTFGEEFRTSVVLAFGEAMLSSRNRYNKTGMYMKDKPQNDKRGMTLLMTCCAEIAYCVRCVLYLRVPCVVAFILSARLHVCMSAAGTTRVAAASFFAKLNMLYGAT